MFKRDLSLKNQKNWFTINRLRFLTFSRLRFWFKSKFLTIFSLFRAAYCVNLVDFLTREDFARLKWLKRRFDVKSKPYRDRVETARVK